MTSYHEYRVQFEENRKAVEASKAAGETADFRTTYHDHEDGTPMSALTDLPDGRVIWTSEHGQQLTFESREEAVQWMKNDRPEETVHEMADGEYTVKARPAGGYDVMKVRGMPGYPRNMEIGETVYFPTLEQAVEFVDQQQPRVQLYDDDDKMFIHLAQDVLTIDEQVNGHPWFVECPGRFRVFFGTVEQADDWVHAQWLGSRFPYEMSEGDVHDCGRGFYVDLRS